jgi:hypothetical protein
MRYAVSAHTPKSPIPPPAGVIEVCTIATLGSFIGTPHARLPRLSPRIAL